MSYLAADDRYEQLPYRRVGHSGLHLPAVSLGLWQNFGDVDPLDRQRAVLRRAFDLGVTHFDLANNYGPPPGSAEESFGSRAVFGGTRRLTTAEGEIGIGSTSLRSCRRMSSICSM